MLTRKGPGDVVRKLTSIAWVAAAIVGGASTATAVPFSVATTSRESVRVSAIGPAPTYPRTYAALTADSKELVFQEAEDGKLYLAFASKDASIDDLQLTGGNYNRCVPNGKYQVWWVDKLAALPGVCVSYNPEYAGIEGKTGVQDSERPQIGGPAGEEGRYIVYESLATNLRNVSSSPGVCGYTPAARQLIVHDRKFEYVWLSTSWCQGVAAGADALCGGRADSVLWQLSEDGQYPLFISASSNLADNITPKCSGGSLLGDIFVRDGGSCKDLSRGACTTKVKYDQYGLHAGPNDIEFLDAAADHAFMTPDQKIIAFDSAATYPVKYNPDVRGKKDIFIHKNDEFALVSQVQVPRCSILGELLPIKSVDGPPDGDSTRPRLDSSGRYLVFESNATDLLVNAQDATMICKETLANGTLKIYYPHPKNFSYVSTGGKSQIYFFDNVTKTIELVSKGFGTSVGADGDSTNAWLSRDAHYIIFESSARNLLSTQTTNAKNIFMYDRIQKKMFLVTLGTGGNGVSSDATITHVSKNGLTVAFQTSATDAVEANDANGGSVPGTVQHVYLAQNSCPIDTDGDTVPDCLDLCANDVAKTEPGQCGCGKLETDDDNDGTANCVDKCPADSTKTTSVGVCGCGIAETDSDSDGTPNCTDKCPADAAKTAVGKCGCGVAETDTDADGTPDCTDACAANPARSVAGSCGCSALKDEPGVCGCNVADTDGNKNGAADCLDPTTSTVPAQPTVDITKVRSSSGATLYQLLVRMQRFTGTVNYSASLTRSGYRSKKSTKGSLVGFSRLKPGTYTYTYSVSVGEGSSKVESKQTSVTIAIPGGIKKSS